MSQIVTKEELDLSSWPDEADQHLFDPDIQRDMDWFLKKDFPEELEGKFVAIHQCQIVAEGNDPQSLCQEASQKTGVPENKISVQFIIPRRMAVLIQGKPCL